MCYENFVNNEKKKEKTCFCFNYEHRICLKTSPTGPDVGALSAVAESTAGDVAPPLLDNMGWALVVSDVLLRGIQRGTDAVFGGQMLAEVHRQQGRAAAVDGTFDAVDLVRV